LSLLNPCLSSAAPSKLKAAREAALTLSKYYPKKMEIEECTELTQTVKELRKHEDSKLKQLCSQLFGHWKTTMKGA
jgi:hypothetical protein